MTHTRSHMNNACVYSDDDGAHQGLVMGILGEGLIIFKELESNGNFFRDLGSKLIVLGI